MSETKDGGPAFPMASDVIGHCGGMSLRDWFAGQALGSIPLRDWSNAAQHGDQNVIDSWAICAYALADAMLAAREGGAA